MATADGRQNGIRNGVASASAATDEMRGRVCLVTGATGGIGLVAARALAAKGATVVLTARDAGRAETLVQQIRYETGNTQVNFLLADLSSQAQVRRLAEEFQRSYPTLHVLVNNAGGLFMRRVETVDGYELTFALNHLAPFLLTNLLLDELKASAPARVVTVSSAAHVGAQIHFDDLMYSSTRYSPMGAYGQSKLANAMFAYELARRLEGTGVTSNALHPGFVATGFAKNNGTLYRYGMTLLRPFAISPEQGAQTTIYLASSPEVEGVSGEYFVKRRPAKSSKASYDEEAQRRLWEVSEELTGLKVGAQVR